jgi:hypothetical protein
VNSGADFLVADHARLACFKQHCSAQVKAGFRPFSLLCFRWAEELYLSCPGGLYETTVCCRSCRRPISGRFALPQYFQPVIEKAKEACVKSGHSVADHFHGGFKKTVWACYF